jgi:hypothetical protein
VALLSVRAFLPSLSNGSIVVGEVVAERKDAGRRAGALGSEVMPENPLTAREEVERERERWEEVSRCY